MSVSYERELRSILEGDVDAIEKISKTMTNKSTGIYERLVDNPFLVVRGGGSLGIDIVALRGSEYLPIEVKSSKEKRRYFRDREFEQYSVYRKITNKCNVPILYSLRVKGIRGEKYVIFSVDKNDLQDRFNLPVLPTTNRGNKYLNFDDGMLLSDFIRGIL